MNDFHSAVRAGLVGGLQTMKALLDAAEAHAAENKSAVDELLQAQLYPDMFPFWRQVPSGCNVARRCVDRLSGQPIHDPERPEPTLAALRAHVDETIASVQASDAAAIAATEGEVITAKLAKQRPRPRIYEVGISYSGRTYEEGKKIGWKDGVRAFYCIVRYNLFK